MPGKRKRLETDNYYDVLSAVSKTKTLQGFEEKAEKQRQKRRRIAAPISKSQVEKGLAVGWDLKGRTELAADCVQDLLLGALGLADLPKWVQLTQSSTPPHICVVTAPGLQPSLYTKAHVESPWLHHVFRKALRTRIQGRLRGDSHLWALWVLKGRRNDELATEAGEAEEAAEDAEASGSDAEMKSADGALDQTMEEVVDKVRRRRGTADASQPPQAPAPPAAAAPVAVPLADPTLPDLELPPGYRRLPPRPADKEAVMWAAIDCEMCTTTAGPELARVSVVHGCGAVLYNTLVQPTHKVTDYLTHITGLTPLSLLGVTTTLSDVQRDLAALLFEDTLLVGHSLSNDLHALKLVHQRVIDTAVVFGDPAVPAAKPALRKLAHQYLHRSIQGFATSYYPREEGVPPSKVHDSVEDAAACLDLVRFRLAQGPGFVPHTGVCNLLKRAHAAGRLVKCVGPGATLDQFAPREVDVAATADDGAATRHAVTWLAACDTPSLVWLHLRSFDAYYQKLGHPHAAVGPKWERTVATDEEVSLLQDFDGAVRRLIETAPANTLFVVWTGQGPSHTLRRFKAPKPKEEQPLREGMLWLYAKPTAQAPRAPAYQARAPAVVATHRQVKAKKYRLKNRPTR